MAKFLPGKSGNPAGKKKGTLNRRTQLVKILEPYAEELISKAVELARNGDVNALRLCIERLIPKAKNESLTLPISIDDTKDLGKLLNIHSAIIEAITSGELTAEQGKALSGVLGEQVKFIFFADVEKRINRIEQLVPQIKKNDIEYY
jgi:hypothetical protein